MHDQIRDFRRPLTVVVFVAITIPLMVHTAQLLLLITHITPSWLAWAYAGFFAVGFDLAVFMFSLYDLKGAKKTFAVMAGVVGFFFFNLEILFEQLPGQAWASGRLWASVVLGTMFAVVGAYLVYHSTELINQVFQGGEGRRGYGVRDWAASTVELGVRRTAQKPGRHPAKPNPQHLRPKPQNGDSQDEKIMVLKEEGKTNAEIGRQLGISDRTVRRRLQTIDA